MLSFELWLIISTIFFASTAGTITGFGTSTIMMPILMIYYPLTEALFFVSIIHWFNALWRLLMFRKEFDLKLVMSFGLAGIIFAHLGARALYLVNEALMIKIIAGFLILYAIFLFRNPQFKIKFSYLTGSLSGILSGFVAGISGMGGTIRAAFLAAFNLPKEVYLANSALILILIDSSRLLTYFQEGERLESILDLDLYFHSTEIGLIICIAISFCGALLGKKLVAKIPQEQFRLWISLVLILIALKILF